MQSFGRPRQYVSAARLYAMFPLLRFSHERGAYVLRFVGETRGPVLRKDRRRRRQREFTGPDRREGGVDLEASRPMGGVRRVNVSKTTPGTTDATSRAQAAPRASGATPRRTPSGPASRRRQHGRQRPPRPHR
jgi:hypothetical protein